MYKPKNQRRTLTERLVKEALIELLKTQSIQQISITQLCREAGINRTTFYVHFVSAYDVLRSMENSIVEEVQAIAAKSPPGVQSVERVCQYLKDSGEHVRTVMRCNGMESDFAQRLFDIPELRGQICTMLSSDCDDVERRLMLMCYSRGGYALIRQWLLEDLPKSPAEIARMVSSLATRGWTGPEKK